MTILNGSEDTCVSLITWNDMSWDSAGVRLRLGLSSLVHNSNILHIACLVSDRKTRNWRFCPEALKMWQKSKCKKGCPFFPISCNPPILSYPISSSGSASYIVLLWRPLKPVLFPIIIIIITPFDAKRNFSKVSACTKSCNWVLYSNYHDLVCMEPKL